MTAVKVINFPKQQAPQPKQEAGKSMYSDKFVQGYVMSSRLYRKEVWPFLSDAARNVYAELENRINGHNKESDFVSYSQLQGGELEGSRQLGRKTVSFGIKEQKIKTVKIVPKTSDLIKVYADKRLIFFSILALVQQGILMATCMSFTTQIAHEINASAFQIGLLSIVYIIVAVLASYFSASNFARRLGSSLWIPFILFVLAIYCFAVPNIFSPNLLIAIQILAGLSTGIVFSFCTSEAMKNVPIEKRSTAMGYYQAIYAVGMTIVPMIAGNIAEIYNLNIAFYLEGIIAVIATVASMIYFKYDNRKTIKG